MKDNYPVITFRTAEEFSKWLNKFHTKSPGILLRIYKKDSGEKTITYGEALDEALCYGWIDGQKNSYDDISWLQKFTPRRSGSSWSKNNTLHAERLIKAGKMKNAGLNEINNAKADGRWQSAYSPQSTATIPEDFLDELSRNKKAEVFFATLNKTNLYSIAYRLQTAKKIETRRKRIKTIIEMLSKGQIFHS